jgi:serine/threonine protein kinase
MQERIGGGQVCEVWRAWDERLHASVICKLIRPEQVADESAWRVLRRESAMLARLAHPMVVRQFDAALERPHPHLVLEDLGAPNLRRRLRRRGPLSIEQTLILGRQLASALHYIAAAGVVHLDVKPSNLVRAGPLRLIDFGLARMLARASTLRRPVGTARYMAPELCTPGQRGEIGPAADIWGLGATLHEALTGAPPFATGDEAKDASPELRYPQLHAPAPALPEGVPPRLEAMIRACLEREPGTRPAAASVAAELGGLEGKG